MIKWAVIFLVGCGGPALRPSDVAHLQPGQAVRVHVWPPGAPGPGYTVKGTFQSADDTKIVVMQDGKPVEIYRQSIHDDTMDVR
ncbi:MAG TPA: hypothetical protein VGH28_22550 [Polyangiaceae bacterium]|jgi:hypothetical protein